MRDCCIRELQFADDAAIVSHTETDLQSLMDHFSNACRAFGLTISLKKTQVLAQGVEKQPSVTISEYVLEAVNAFVYLGSTLTDNLTMELELNRRIGKAATTYARLSKRVWTNNKLSVHTKVQVYNACVLSTLLYGSECWTLHSHEERRLNSFHLRCLRRLLGITWRDKITNVAVLERAGTQSVTAKR